jgi:DNA-binding beta-propeller fold protein YncE
MRSLLFLLLLASPALADEHLELVASGLKEPFGLDFLPDGSIVLAEYGNHTITRIDRAGKVSVLAGVAGQKGNADGPPDKAQFNGPHNVAVAADGTIYVSDTLNHTVRKIDAKSREVTTLAGTGKKGFAGNEGHAKDAVFNETYHVVLDRGGRNLYVADLGNRHVRKIDLMAGTVVTVAGNGKKGVPDDGAKATEAPLVDPRACALDSRGRLYILERGGHALRVVEDGKIRSVAGTGKPGAAGDDGPGTKAQLSGPKLIWVDRNDDVLIADADNNLIRKYAAKDGTLIRVAGTGKKGKSEPGPLRATILANPHGVAVAPDGTLYISDSLNGRVLRAVK